MTTPPTASPEPWALDAMEVAAGAGVDPQQGLSAEEARRRLARHGPNQLRERRPVPAWRIFLRQFRGLVVALLFAAAVSSLAMRQLPEGIAILAVLALNAVLGFLTELRAVRSMEALRELGTTDVRVRRDGASRAIPAEEVVPGDVVVLEAGDIVAADLRLVAASGLQVDESALTGESVPVEKSVAPVAPDTPLAERTGMVFKGTAVTRGSAIAVVVATGMATELGRIAELVEDAGEQHSPLDRRLAELAHRLVVATLVIAGVTALIGVLGGRDLFAMVQTGIALAVAAIPEGLPVVATITLARGMLLLARRNALINRLAAVETLGSTSVIVTDKTGTLTENRMTLRRLVTADQDRDFAAAGEREPHGTLLKALEIAVLCNDAELTADDTPLGDPLDAALLDGARRAGVDVRELERRLPRIAAEAFDPSRRLMATQHRTADGAFFAVKGAAEAVLAASRRLLHRDGERPLDEELRRNWLAREHELARDGLRVIAVAGKHDAATAPPYEGLTFVGLVGLLDPPRSDVRPALEACRSAGIRVVVATGDQATTARRVAEDVGLLTDGEDRIMLGRDIRAETEADREALRSVALFARVDPAQKLDIVSAHQRAGAVVAMTGDGVNDAPALEKADIGVAMGIRGTQVAREAADMVLRDDSFASIVAAVRQGRVVFDNIRKVVLYLLSCNVSEVLIVAGAIVVQAPLPVLPLQILFLNLVTDVFPALALATGRGDDAVMQRPPRPASEPIVTRRGLGTIVGYAALITASVLAALAVALHVLEMPHRQAVSVSFLTLAFAQMLHVFDMREPGTGPLRNDVTRNGWVYAALLVCTGLLLAALWWEPVREVMQLEDPGPTGWLVVASGAAAPVLIGQTVSALLAARRRRARSGIAARPPRSPGRAG